MVWPSNVAISLFKSISFCQFSDAKFVCEVWILIIIVASSVNELLRFWISVSSKTLFNFDNSVCLSINSCSWTGVILESSVNFCSVEVAERLERKICCGVPKFKVSAQVIAVGCKAILAFSNCVSSLSSDDTILKRWKPIIH